MSRQRYFYDMSNIPLAMVYLKEDTEYVIECLKYCETQQFKQDMNFDREKIQEEVKNQTVIFKGLLRTKERFIEMLRSNQSAP